MGRHVGARAGPRAARRAGGAARRPLRARPAAGEAGRIREGLYLTAFDLLGARRRGLRAARRIPETAPRIEVEIAGGRGTRRFAQELLHDGEDAKITLQLLDQGFEPVRIDGRTTLGPGSLLVWYVFPGEAFEIGAFYHPRGAFLGHYVNLIRPPALEEDAWKIEDRYLDVWVPARGDPVLLDRDELDAAVERGEIPIEEATEIRAHALRWLAAAQGPRWLPRVAREWPGELVPALRLRRDAPGTFHAARTSGRIIAYGLYLMGAVSATCIVFAAFTDAFVVAGPALEAFKWSLAAEAVALAPLVMWGRLPATHWPQPALTDERSLFVATLASGLAVLALNERAEWSEVLIPVYGVLGGFSALFAICRAWFDRTVPVFALAGVLVMVVALWFLL